MKIRRNSNVNVHELALWGCARRKRREIGTDLRLKVACSIAQTVRRLAPLGTPFRKGQDGGPIFYTVQQQNQLEPLSGEKEEKKGCCQENKQTHKTPGSSRTANLCRLKRANMSLWGNPTHREAPVWTPGRMAALAQEAGPRTHSFVSRVQDSWASWAATQSKDAYLRGTLMLDVLPRYRQTRGCCLVFHESSQGDAARGAVVKYRWDEPQTCNLPAAPLTILLRSEGQQDIQWLFSSWPHNGSPVLAHCK